MQVRVLGTVQVTSDNGDVIDIGQRKVRQLIAVLALAARPVPSDELEAMLWVTADTHSKFSALTNTVSRARKVLPEGRLTRDSSGYRLVLDQEGDVLDVQRFRELVAQARSVREADAHKAADLYGQALGLWRNPRLPDLPDAPAGRRHAERLTIERRNAVEAWTEVRLALGHHEEVAQELTGFLADDPLNEYLWLPLILALYRAGRKGAALQAYEDAWTTYLTEVGAEPALSLQGMAERIAANDDSLRWSSEQPVHESRAIIAGSDITQVSSARVYNFLLGGTDNFPVDQAVVEHIMKAAPDLKDGARDTRAFLRKSVRLLAERGIRQFIDIGAGLPTSGSVHEVAHEVDPDCRVLYVDIDPIVVAHGRALLEDTRNVDTMIGDLLEPDAIFAAPQTRRLINPAEATGVLMFHVLHFMPADTVHEALEKYRAWMAPGSALAISHISRDGSVPEALKAIQEISARTGIPTYTRSGPEIEALFTGTHLLAPLDDPRNWQAKEGEREDKRAVHILASIGELTG
ncbi:SAM-dependent methyltransferase [Actinomadura alba]|uniref:SAM-dependent methyltransferase n=1 Tax=Actinomadura alba TaxID=406431 RepID=A0ABR7LPC9_9ACTN|nr:SAM-dependent methyltransferase [Actinomadura alba]MBC6466644.1 SAM-dependent methyltransferase [Actinomadura alba]